MTSIPQFKVVIQITTFIKVPEPESSSNSAVQEKLGVSSTKIQFSDTLQYLVTQDARISEGPV